MPIPQVRYDRGENFIHKFAIFNNLDRTKQPSMVNETSSTIKSTAVLVSPRNETRSSEVWNNFNESVKYYFIVLERQVPSGTPPIGSSGLPPLGSGPPPAGTSGLPPLGSGSPPANSLPSNGSPVATATVAGASSPGSSFNGPVPAVLTSNVAPAAVSNGVAAVAGQIQPIKFPDSG